MEKTLLRSIAGILSLAGLILFTYVSLFYWNKVGQWVPGFAIFDNSRVCALVDPTWTGYKAGLKVADEIQSYNGIPFSTNNNLLDYVKQSTSGEPINYHIKRGEQFLELAIPPMLLSRDFYFIYILSPIIIGVLGIIYGLLPLWVRPKTEIAFYSFAILFPGALHMALSGDVFINQKFFILFNIGICFYVVIDAHAALMMSEGRNLPDFWTRIKQRKWIFLTTYVLTFLSAFVFKRMMADENFSQYQLVRTIAYLPYFLGMIVVYGTSLYHYFTSKSAAEKIRYQTFIMYHLLLLSGAIYFVFNNIFSIILPFEMAVFLLLFPFIGILLSLYYNFLNFSALPSRIWLYLGTGFFLTLMIALDFTLFPAIFRKYGVVPSVVTWLIFSLIVFKVICFVLIAYFRLIERVFFPSSFKFHQMIREAGNKMPMRLSTEEILKAAKQIILENIPTKTVLFYANENGHYRRHSTRTEFPSVLPVPITDELLAGENISLGLEELDAKPNGLRNFMKQHNLSLMLPFIHQDTVQGLVFLGGKEKNLPYSPEDISNLKSIFAIGSMAYANALAYQTILGLQERLKTENKLLRQEIRGGEKSSKIIGEDKGLAGVFEMINGISDSSMTVLLTGESGTGKEVIATAIHDRSPRAHQALVKVNCTAIPENLMESEFFGHEKGAFTGADARKIGLFEAADKGTLFLDEIGEIPLNLQPKLLRALESREIRRVGGNESIPVDVRVIAATNVDLKKSVEKKIFRQDLFYRLNVMPIKLPALRDRKEDIEDLTYYFFNKFCRRMNRSLLPPGADTIAMLKEYSWPGNVRELQNVIERAVALSKEGTALAIPYLEDETNHGRSFEAVFDKPDFNEQMNYFKKMIVQKAIAKADGNKSAAARYLGVHVVSFFKMIKQLGLK